MKKLDFEPFWRSAAFTRIMDEWLEDYRLWLLTGKKFEYMEHGVEKVTREKGEDTFQDFLYSSRTSEWGGEERGYNFPGCSCGALRSSMEDYYCWSVRDCLEQYARQELGCDTLPSDVIEQVEAQLYIKEGAVYPRYYPNERAEIMRREYAEG
jgi:hypothetical protein